MELTTWDAVLEAMDSLPDDVYLCFASGPERGDEEVALVADHEPLPVDEDVPTAATERGLTRTLNVDQIRDVRDNLVAQHAMVSAPMLRRAVDHYIENDAFIDVASHHP